MPESENGGENQGGGAVKPAIGPDTLLGRVIGGRYRIESLIARGGMGRVYRAEQVPLGRVCALKILSPAGASDVEAEFNRRFFLEAATAARLSHPNTVTIFDYGNSDELYYIAMEYIDGRTLQRVIHDEGPLAEDRAGKIARQICRSLREAHALGVVHRDLKPGNVLLTTRDEEIDHVKVLDFGLVKDVTGAGPDKDLTQTGLLMGSPKYMAPEQIMGADVSPRTDVYALGVVLYEMIAGKVPFDRGANFVTLSAHVHDPPPPIAKLNPDAVVSPAMEQIVYRCLEKDPVQRFASMDDLLSALKVLGGEWNVTSIRPGFALGARIASQSQPPPPAAPIVDDPSSSDDTTTRVSMESRIREEQALSATPSAPPPPPSTSPAPAAPAETSATDSLRPAPPEETQAFEARLRTKRRGLVAAAAVAGLGVAALLLVTRDPTPLDPATPAQPSHVPPIAEVPASGPAIATTLSSATPASAPRERTVRVESVPAGATVSENGRELCKPTPCDVTWRGDEAAAGSAHVLTVDKRGFRPATLPVDAAASRVNARLEARKAAGGGDTAAPDGYKPSPY